MDIEPIYCVEQIVIPAGLDTVLKDFTKAVVHQQPSNLVEFAASYFAKQAELERVRSAVVPPTLQQLRSAYQLMRAGAQSGGDAPCGVLAAPLADVEAACESAGISGAALAQALRAGNINTAQPVAVVDVLVLLLAMRCSGLGSVMRAAFDVFGEPHAATVGGGGGGGGGGADARLGVPELLQALAALGARDPEATPALREAVARGLEGRASVAGVAGLAAAVPALAPKLAAAAAADPAATY